MTDLTLNVLRCPDAAVPESRSSSGGDLVLGRGLECDWQLLDPERVLSKKHCVLEYRAGGWQVRDLSTNGTFLNHQAAPIGRDLVATLADGDRLRLGSYEIEVRLAARQGQAAAAPWGASQAGAWGASPAGMGRQAPDIYDNPLAPPVVQGPSPGFGNTGGGLPDDWDPLADEGPMADHSPAASYAMPPPRSVPPATAIPDDWDRDFDLSPIVPPAEPVQAFPPAAPVLDSPPVVPERPPVAFAPPVAPPESPVTAAPIAAPAPWDSAPPAIPVPPATPMPATVVPQAVVDDPWAEEGVPSLAIPAPAAPAVIAPVAPAAASAPAGGVEAALALLLQGAGLPVTALAGADPAAVLLAAGANLRAAVAGLRALLSARADVKREFRIEQTILSSGGANPLKFSMDDDAALAGLLHGKGSRPGQATAVTATVADLNAHQVASLAATQAAARALLDKLAPAGIEAADKGGGFLGAREKRLWEAYRALHGQLLDQFEDDFDSAFGKAFARAYEEASRKG